MKKLLLLLLCMPLMFSCGGDKEQTSEDINLETLKEPCDFVNANLKVVNDLINLAKKYDYEIISEDSEDYKKILSFRKRSTFIFARNYELFGHIYNNPKHIDCENYDLLFAAIADKKFEDWCELFPELE